VKLFDTYYNLYLTFYLNTLKIHHSTLLPSVDIVRFWIFIFYKVVQQHNKCDLHATE